MLPRNGQLRKWSTLRNRHCTKGIGCGKIYPVKKKEGRIQMTKRMIPEEYVAILNEHKYVQKAT